MYLIKFKVRDTSIFLNIDMVSMTGIKCFAIINYNNYKKIIVFLSLKKYHNKTILRMNIL